MNTIVIQTQNDEELAFVQDLLQKNNVQSKVVSDDDIEDSILLQYMLEVNTKDIVPRERIFKKLIS